MKADDQERQFLLGIFLMEAWDTLATLEDGLARLRLAGEVTPEALEPLVVVAHRLCGTAALQGFPALSGIAGTTETVLENAVTGSQEARQQAVLFLGDVVGVLKRVFDQIGATGQEDADGIAAFRAGHPGTFAAQPPERLAEPPEPSSVVSPSAPAADGWTGSLRLEIERFFAENAEILPYFGPEAAEHLETMTRSLLALEKAPASEEELGTLFRAVHTLKGAAYTVGCTPVGDLAHQIEDLLAGVREHRIALDPTVIEGVFAGVDALRLLLGSAGGAAPELPDVVRRTVDGLTGLMLAPETTVPPAVTALPEPAALAMGGLEPAASERVEPEPVVPEPVVSGPFETEPVATEAALSPPVVPDPTVSEAAAPAAGPDAPGREPGLPAPTPHTLAPRSRPAPAKAPVPPRPGIRVNLERLDALMNLVGELVIGRSRLDLRLHELSRVGELLVVTRARMARAVKDFQGKQGVIAISPATPATPAAGGPGDGQPATDRRAPFDELFAELEFDRYDDVDLLARSVTEISADLSEVQSQLAALIRTIAEDTGQIQRLTGSLRNEITRARMVPMGRLFARFTRQVREVAKATGKTVVLEVSGESVEVDNTIIEQIADPLLHLVQNAVTHGIEPEDERRARSKPPHGTVGLRAYHQGGFIYVEVEDDGRGIDVELVKAQAVRQELVRADAARLMDSSQALNLIFVPGFSTAPLVTTASGRGVGMDVVRTNVSRVNGEIDIETEVGVGTRFVLKLPLTVVISDALMVRVGSEPLAIPLNAVRVIREVGPHEIEAAGSVEMVRVDDQLVDFIRLDRMLGLPSARKNGAIPVVVLRAAGRSVAVGVDELSGKEEIVIKSLGGLVDGIGPFAGATISGEGRVILLVDPIRLVETARGPIEARPGPADAMHLAGFSPAVRSEPDTSRRVLLVDDSVSVRKFVGYMLERAGFTVFTATDGAEALEQLAETSVHAVITDLEMPRVNGYELIQGMRMRAATRDVPVVVLTTRAGDKHVSLARRLGIAHYVTKPVDEDAFVQLIETVTGARFEAVSHAS